jgi:glycosyltransferase involved in cell wall biosynthesis
MIAFHYPPDHSSSGFLRTLKFSKYLPDRGWCPVVLTVNESHYDTVDTTFLSQIPRQVTVHRTPAINTKKSLAIRGKYLGLFSTPDRYVGWLLFGVPAGLSLIRNHRIQAIYSTSPMATSHLIAYVLKRLTGLPWIADFRDPWTEPEITADPHRFLFRLDMGLETAVLRRADRLIFTTARLRDYMLAHAGIQIASRSVVIPNGFDEEDFSELPGREPEKLPVRITHTGLVDQAYRSPRPFLETLSTLLKNGEVSYSEVRVKFVGGGPYVESPQFRTLLGQLGLANLVEVVGRVSYTESLEHQQCSHILLLLQSGDDTRTLIPAKAFEYLRVGRLILALVPESATSELFKEVGGAKIVDTQDRPGMIAALREMIADARAGAWKSSVNLQALRTYSRRELTARLADELDLATARDSVRDSGSSWQCREVDKTRVQL